MNTAERMRVYRTRRRNGLRCVRVLLSEAEIDELVRQEFLEPAHRHDQDAVEGAIGAFVSDALGRAGR